ncbi:patatin family protein [Bacillaceae bacterium IKA-2]|nr:patatin family protein [Bacillaceae bacterium IKA-2]
MVVNIGLVLEGGGMRGVYTGGVLEYFSEQELIFPYIIGVSAGACNGASYISKQRGRNKQVTIDLIDHPKYLSYRNFLRHKQLLGMDFIFDEIPNQIVPFDYQTFAEAKQKFFIGTTDCHTGKPHYFEKNNLPSSDFATVLKASSSLPLIAPIVKYNGMELLDGGISDPVPIKKSVQDGNTKNVVILTRNSGYQKKKQAFPWLVNRPYKNYPELVEKMKERHNHYNSALNYIEEQETSGNAFVFRPSKTVKVSRLERDKSKLTELYNLGFNDAKELHEKLVSWLQR